MLTSNEVAVADTNGDGIPDIITSSGNGTAVLFGNGDGTFSQGPSIDLNMINGVSFAAGDLRGNGEVDVVLVGGWETSSTPQGIGVCLGNGNGTFQQPVYYQAGNDTGLSHVVIGDFNGDGIPDAASVGDQGVWLFIGAGGGKFKPAVLTPLSDLSTGAGFLAAADLTGNGKLDLVVTQDQGFAVLLGNGDGTFQPATTFSTQLAPGQLAIGDLNMDGHPDIAIMAHPAQDVSVFFGNGSGGFSKPTSVYLPGDRYLAIADVNGDGIPDLINGQVYVAFGNGNGTFQPPVYYATQSAGGGGGGVGNVVPAFLRRKGLTDLVAQGSVSTVSVLLNQGKGTYEDGVWTPVAGGAGCGAPADYNGDGKPDLAVANANNTIAILLGTGKAAAPFTAGSIIPVMYPGCPVSGDLNGDGIPDLVVPVYYPPPAKGGAVLAYLNNGDGTFTLKSTTPVPTFDYYLALADFNKDGKLGFASAGNYWALGNGDGTFQKPTTLIPDFPYCQFSFIAAGDINNDGWPDLAVTCYSGASVYVLLNNHSGGFTESTFETGVSTPPGGILLSDLNGDGNLDAVIPEALNGGVVVYLGNGQGGFTFEQALSDSIGTGTTTVADLNGDGIPDIAYDEEGSLAIFLGNGDGTFAAPFYVGTGPSPTDLFAENLHGQPRSAGVPDLVEPDGTGGVTVLINTTKTTGNAWPIW